MSETLLAVVLKSRAAGLIPQEIIEQKIFIIPEDFMFSLTRQEINNLSQIVISSKIKHAPNVFVFTEQGVAMLSSKRDRI